ncbi:MAG: GNAT family protein [Chloroflexota bacterium]|nr:GNAT family protein [Chloroflexota bacterium]MDE2884593.1 GNAT family protein [Chloroflexota bacterium]
MEIPAGDWVLRPWRVGDEPALVKYANNRNIWINVADVFPHPYTMEDAVAWVQLQKDRDPQTEFAIANADEAIGGIGLRPQSDIHRRSAEVGYWLGEPFWGQGITTHALRVITEYAFQAFDLVRVYASVKEWNPASARVLEKCGFTLEGRLRRSFTKDGETGDLFLYALVRE